MSEKINHQLVTCIVLIIATLGFFATDSYLPALPAITEALHSTPAIIQSTITSYLLGFALMQLVYGPLSDRFGRRKILLSGFTIAIVGGLASMVAKNAEMLILARLIQGAGVAAGAALFRTILRDIFTGHKLADAIATISTFFAIVPAIAPAIGAHLQAWFGWQANFVFISAYTFCAWIIILYFLPETHVKAHQQPTKISTIVTNYYSLLTSKTFMGHVLCSGLTFAMIIAYAVISPFLFQTILKLSPIQYGWLSLYIGSGLLMGKILNKYLLKKMNFLRVLLLGLIVNLIAGTIMLSGGYFEILNVNIIMLPMASCIVGCGLILSNAATGAFIPFPKIAGTAGGLYGCLQVLGAFITGQIISVFHIQNQIPLATTIISLSLLGITSYFFLIRADAAATESNAKERCQTFI